MSPNEILDLFDYFFNGKVADFNSRNEKTWQLIALRGLALRIKSSHITFHTANDPRLLRVDAYLGALIHTLENTTAEPLDLEPVRATLVKILEIQD